MASFSFAKKMLLIGSIFTLPIALLVIVLYLQIKDDIDFAKQERLGAQYTRVLRPLFFDLEEYRTADATVRIGVARRIAVDLIAAHAEDRTTGAPLGLSDLLATVTEHWHRQASADASLADVLGLLVAVSDNSKITLDPILDGYYVGDTMVDKLPHLIDGIAQSGVIGTRILSGGRLSQSELTTITMMSAEIATNGDGVTRNLPIAERVAPYLRPGLDDPRRRTAESVAAFGSSLRETISAPSARQLAAATFTRRANDARYSAFDLYDATIAAMDDVLHHRIDNLVYMRI